MTTTRTTTRYRVTIARDSNGWWFVDAPDVLGAHSQGQTLERARANIRQAIAAVLDLPPSTEARMELDESLQLPQGAASAVGYARETRDRAEAAAAEARQALTDALDTIQNALPDLGIRDQAELLGVSFQRIAQLRPGAPRRGRRPVPR